MSQCSSTVRFQVCPGIGSLAQMHQRGVNHVGHVHDAAVTQRPWLFDRGTINFVDKVRDVGIVVRRPQRDRPAGPTCARRAARLWQDRYQSQYKPEESTGTKMMSRLYPAI